MHCFLSVYHFLFILHCLYSFSILFLFHVSFFLVFVVVFVIHPSNSYKFLLLFVLLFRCYPPVLAFLVASSHIYFRLPVSTSTFSAFFSSLILFRSFRPFPFICDHISRILPSNSSPVLHTASLFLLPPTRASNFVLLCEP